MMKKDDDADHCGAHLARRARRRCRRRACGWRQARPCAPRLSCATVSASDALCRRQRCELAVRAGEVVARQISLRCARESRTASSPVGSPTGRMRTSLLALACELVEEAAGPRGSPRPKPPSSTEAAPTVRCANAVSERERRSRRMARARATACASAPRPSRRRAQAQTACRAQTASRSTTAASACRAAASAPRVLRDLVFDSGLRGFDRLLQRLDPLGKAVNGSLRRRALLRGRLRAFRARRLKAARELSSEAMRSVSLASGAGAARRP